MHFTHLDFVIVDARRKLPHNMNVPWMRNTIDRLRLIAWATVFFIGVLLIVPVAFKVAEATSSHGAFIAVAAGMISAGIIGYILTAAAMSRASDLRELNPEDRTSYITRLYSVALVVAVSLALDAVAFGMHSDFAWPLALVISVAALLTTARLRSWAMSQASPPIGAGEP